MAFSILLNHLKLPQKMVHGSCGWIFWSVVPPSRQSLPAVWFIICPLWSVSTQSSSIYDLFLQKLTAVKPVDPLLFKQSRDYIYATTTCIHPFSPRPQPHRPRSQRRKGHGHHHHPHPIRVSLFHHPHWRQRGSMALTPPRTASTLEWHSLLAQATSAPSTEQSPLAPRHADRRHSKPSPLPSRPPPRAPAKSSK